MLQRILGVVLIVLGLAAGVLGVASATVWRQSDTVVATLASDPSSTLVVTDPGVLDLVDPDVTIRATSPDGGKVTLAIGRDVDVAGWVGDDPYTRVTGLADWTTLASTAGTAPTPTDDATATSSPTASATATASPTASAKATASATTGATDEALVGPEPAGSDMWAAEASGEGTASLRWADQDGRWSLIAAGVGEDAVAPTVELTWPREATTPWLWPGVVAGIVLVVAGAALLLLGRSRRRGPKSPTGTSGSTRSAGGRRAEPSNKAGGTPSTGTGATGTGPADGTPTVATPVVGATLTRRELREQAEREQAEQARAARGRSTSDGDTGPRRAWFTGQIPRVRAAEAEAADDAPASSAGTPGAESAPPASRSDEWRKTWGFSPTKDDDEGAQR